MSKQEEQHDDASPAALRGAAGAGRPGNLVRRLQSQELFGRGAQANDQVIIEHSGREYRLRVTSNGKLILTA